MYVPEATIMVSPALAEEQVELMLDGATGPNTAADPLPIEDTKKVVIKSAAFNIIVPSSGSNECTSTQVQS